MATEKTSKIKRNLKPKGLSPTQRWAYGFILLFISCYMIVGIACHYFMWAEDQDIVKWGALFDSATSQTENYVGPLGALIGHYVVGEWFGVFGIIIPIVLFILGLRIMRFKTMYLRKMVRISLCIMILGSVTLGAIFDDFGSFFGTGLGGAHGIFISRWLQSFLGPVGIGLLLLTLIILLAVYINHRTINVVNKVGKGIVHQGAKVGGAMSDVVSRGASKKEHIIEDEEKEDEFTYSNDLDSSPETPKDESFEVVNTLEQEGEIQQEEPTTKLVVEEFGDFKVVSLNSTQEQPSLQNKEQAQTPVSKKEGDFEIIDYSSSGTPISIGGVIESEAKDGFVNADDQMKVVVAERRDVVVDQDDIENTLYDPTLELSSYERPGINLLEDHSVHVRVTEEEIYEHKNRIVETLNNFSISVQKIMATIGPTVTLYEIIPAPGVRISKIKGLEDDIALSLSALGIRIIAPIPGKGTIGIEVPNKDKEVVSMQSVVRSMKFQESKFDLPVVLGKTISNETYVMDLAKMPHLLIAGATGQGKSVGLNAILTSLLYKKHPSELKLVLIDPKKVELTLYSKLERHFLAKMPGDDDAIITDTHKVVNTLNSLCVEMDARYDLLRKAEVRQIKEYNDKFTKRRLNPEKGHRYLPYIVVIIDEFADLIMTAGREIETPIARLAQLARAIGIHLVIATQRPTTNIITGLIKANFPSRIAFRVTSMIDSRTILDTPGANQLIGRGDMLVSTGSDLVRVQCAFVDTPEVESITEFIRKQRGYSMAYELPEYIPEGADAGSSKGSDMGQLDPMFEEVAQFVVQSQQGSTSAIQRRYSVGYPRAGRIMSQIEAAGIVGAAEGSKPREVLVRDMETLQRILNELI